MLKRFMMHFLQNHMLLPAIFVGMMCSYVSKAQEYRPLAPQAQRLAAQLVDSAATDSTNAKHIYDWVTQNIRYDAGLYFRSVPVETHFRLNETAMVLKARKGVCQGYANVFADLCRAAGIPAVVVTGHASQYGADLDLEDPNHAWNAVKYNGSWHLLDATWGAGDLM